MGKPNIRLNPKVWSRVKPTLLKEAVMLLLRIAFLLPKAKEPQDKRGPKSYDYRVLLILLVLRLLLRKSYDDYEIELRTRGDLQGWLGLEKMPGKSTLQREAKKINMNLLRQLNLMLIKQWMKEFTDLILDSSGIRIYGYSIWYSLRIQRKICKRSFDKVHLAVDENNLLIANWFMSKGTANDSPFFTRLLKSFKRLGIVIGDKGYCARKNFQFVVDRFGAPFIAFKENSKGRAKRCPAWSKAFRLWKILPFIYKAIYNKRSKIESVFSALKRRYGDRLYGKTWQVRRKELALRFIAYNLRIILCIKYSREHDMPLWVRA